MKTTTDFLDALRAKLGLPSDGQLAKHLGIHRQYISRYRNNVVTFDDEMSLKVAKILDLDGAYVMACMHHQRAKTPAVRAAWKHTAEVLYGIAAMLAVVVFLPTVSMPHYDGFNVALAGLALPESATGMMYIMSNCRRRIRSTAKRLVALLSGHPRTAALRFCCSG